jgi:hypothetical protein
MQAAVCELLASAVTSAPTPADAGVSWPISAIFGGVIGAIVGAVLTTMLAAHWNRRNWQLQKAAESFAALYEAGLNEITEVKAMSEGTRWRLYEGPTTGLPSVVNELRSSTNSVFVRRMTQYYVFERDKLLRDQAKGLRERYVVYLDQEIERAKAIAENRTMKVTHSVHRYLSTLSSAGLLSELETLAESVGKKYFWAPNLNDLNADFEMLGAGQRPECVNPQSAIRNPQ